MEPTPIRVLLVEDNPGDARLLREMLREAPSLRFDLIHVDRMGEARGRVAEADVILLDLSLPDAHGMETVSAMLDAAPGIPIVVLTGLDDESTATQAVQAGAQDYLVKGQVDGVLLARTIRYARERIQLLQREREARAVAEAAVRGRDEVLRVVSHDLGNSLSAVLVTTNVLLRTLPEEDEGGKTRRGIENIRELAKQMQRLRQDLLDVAMLEAGQLSIERTRLEARGLVEDTVERYGAVAAEKGITLSSRVPAELPPVLADGARLLQVLSNLVSNAIKFTAAGGRIVLGAEETERGVRLFVRDTGCGIPAEHLPRLFDRYWTTRAGNPSGAGLGLAIAKGIVEAHGGRIHAESEVGSGSTFCLVLPTL